ARTGIRRPGAGIRQGNCAVVRKTLADSLRGWGQGPASRIPYPAQISGLSVRTRVRATPIRTAAAPAIFLALTGSPRKTMAEAMAKIGTRLEYTEVRALPICRTAAYQIV